MGLKQNLQKIFAQMKSEKNSDKEKLWRDQRIHTRMFLRRPVSAYIEFEKGFKVPIRDISYGGVRLQLQEGEEARIKNILESDSKVKLLFLHRHIYTDLILVYVHQDNLSAGARFDHQDHEMLIKLREFLEKVKLGQSLEIVKSELLDEKYRMPGWSVFRGRGPTDVVVHIQDGVVQEFLMTSSLSDYYVEFSLKNGIWKTGRTNDSKQTGGAGAQVIPDTHVNEKVRDIMLFILAGVQDNENLQPLHILYDTCFKLVSSEPSLIGTDHDNSEK